MSEHKELTCGVCGKIFKNKQGLDYHIQRSVCEKFACEFCMVRFKSSLGLKYHVDNRICLPPEKIKVQVIQKSSYHKYTLDRSELKLRDILDVTPQFGNTIFGSSNIVIKFCELALCNDQLDQYWGYYINNKGRQYMNVYEGDSWVLKPQLDTFAELTEWAMENLYKYLLDNQPFIDKGYWTKYFMTRDNLNADRHPVKTEVRQKLFCLFANHKSKMRAKMLETGLSLKP